MNLPTFVHQVADHFRGDEERAERIAGVVFRELRERLGDANAACVARCLPTALRPLWVEDDRQPRPIEQSFKLEFLGDVMERGALADSGEAERAVVAVFAVLHRLLTRVSRNSRTISEIFRQLPHDLAVLWQAAEQHGADAPRRRRARGLGSRNRISVAS